MNKLANISRLFMHKANLYSPHWLTALGIAGFITSIFMVAEVSPRVESKISVWLFEHDRDIDTLTEKEKFEIAWRLYAPTAGMVILSTSAILLANRIQTKRLAAIAGLYTATSGTLQKYQEAILNEFGEDKAEKIRGDVSDKTLLDRPVGSPKITGHGLQLMNDELSNRYFYSDMDKVRSQLLDINEEMFNNNWVTLNDVYHAIGLETNVMGQNAGWDISITGMIEIDFTSKITPDGQSCIVLRFIKPPIIL